MRVLFFAIVFSFSCILNAQTIEVTGQVKDEKSRENLEFCTVSVLSPSDSLITGTVTDQKGFYTIELMPGAYKFVYSFIGYSSDTTKVKAIYAKTFLGVTMLLPDVNQLKEVNIKTSASEVQLDRDVQIVTDKMKEGTTTTKEVLEKVNGVTYDRYNNSIKVDNDNKVIILVDGIEKDQEYVKNLTPERLKKIEVIRDPGGRYGLEGYTAVINIILKKDYRGTEVFASERLMLDPDVSDKTQIPVQNGTSLTYNYVYNKVNTYVKAGTDINHFNLQSHITKTYGDSMQILNYPASNDAKNLRVNQMYNNLTAGADFFINPKHTLSVEAGLKHQPFKHDRTILDDRAAIVMYQIPQLEYATFTETRTGSHTFSNSVYYEARPDEKNTITTNFSWNRSVSDYTNTFSEGSFFRRDENGNNMQVSTKYYIEYTRILNPHHNVQLGYGNVWQNNSNSYSANNVSYGFKYSDLRNKAYGYYSWMPSKKFGIKAGCAGESSRPVANGNKNTYLSFNPYGDIKYSPIQALTIKAKYRSATRYPQSSETNPFTTIIDQRSVRTGNPLLKPEVTHKISLQFAVMEGLLSVEPYYHFSDNMIAETGRFLDNGMFEYGYGNLGNYENKGIQAHLTIPFGKSLFLQSDVDFYKSAVEYEGKQFNLKDVAMTEQLIYVHQKTNTVAGLQYQNNLRKFITAQGYQMGDNDFWIVFVQRPFFKQRLSVMALYFLPLDWGCDFNQGGYISTAGYSELKQYDISMLKNMFMFEISYRFNKGKTINKVDKKIEEETGNKPKKLI